MAPTAKVTGDAGDNAIEVSVGAGLVVGGVVVGGVVVGEVVGGVVEGVVDATVVVGGLLVVVVVVAFGLEQAASANRDNMAANTARDRILNLGDVFTIFLLKLSSNRDQILGGFLIARLSRRWTNEAHGRAL